MNLIKFCATSAALLLLCSCDKNDVVLAFNTQDASARTFFLESSLNVLLPEDSANAAESMQSHIKVRSTLNMLVPYDNGSARFEMKVDSVEYTSDKRSVEEFRNIEKLVSIQHFQFKLDSDGTVSDPVVEDAEIKLGEDDIDLVKLFLKIQPVLPAKPVAIGESWERMVTIPGANSVTTVYKSFTLEDVMLHDGAQIAKIGMNLKYKEEPDSTSDLHMESQGFIVGSGSVLFDVSHGAVASATLEINGDLNVKDIVAQDSIPNMHVIQKIKMRSEL
ncbi:MAG: hypothetical protein J6U20_01450 [Fibrobacter sp.]|nr:hypothetical protein [Fibrobacter sp.]